MSLLLASLGACNTPYPAGLKSDDPSVRIRAIKVAGERQDRNALPLLVRQLKDDDPAVRLYAILAIEKITGTRLGYDYAMPETERDRAVKRWENYLRSAPRPARPPASAATTERAKAP
jgi:HEAT repeat protein